MKAGKVKGLDPAGSLRANATRIIGARLEEMLSFADAASEPGASRAQHDMRIAAKRLRYVLEITEDCYGPEARRARGAARDLQSVLGDLHDCDVIAPLLAGSVEAGEGLELLAAHSEGRRARLFVQFRRLWKEQCAAGVWEELRRALRG